MGAYCFLTLAPGTEEAKWVDGGLPRQCLDTAYPGWPWGGWAGGQLRPQLHRLSLQWLLGFSFFLFPGASFSLRSRYRPQHVFFGATIFVLSVGTALLGLKEALLFKLG